MVQARKWRTNRGKGVDNGRTNQSRPSYKTYNRV